MKNIITISLGIFAFTAITLCAQEIPGKKAPFFEPRQKAFCAKCTAHPKFCPPGKNCIKDMPPLPREKWGHGGKREGKRMFPHFGRDRQDRMKRFCHAGFPPCRKNVMMREDDAAKFAKLSRKIRFARMDHWKNPNAETEKALAAAIRNMVEARQNFEIDRAEKALARAKEAVGEREEITKRLLERMKKIPGKKGEMAPAKK